MQRSTPPKPRHMSFVLPPEEHAAFRCLCAAFDLKPSEALRAMVRVALGGGYDPDRLDELRTLNKGDAR